MSIRMTYFLGFLVICGLLLTSAYVQIVDGIMPCPLCILQRFSFGILGLLFLSGIFLHKKRGGRIFINVSATLIAIAGIVLAGRQIWLQFFNSAEGSECGVSLQYMMQVLPWNEVIQKVFAGSSECSQRGWEFLHLNTAEWALIWFVGFLLLSVYLLFREMGKR